MTEVKDHKTVGPKTKDSTRERTDREGAKREPLPTGEERAARSGEEVNAQCTDEAIGGAEQHYHDVTEGGVFGDNTSSTGGANQIGQHGRDGGETNGEDNNPAVPESVLEPEVPEGGEGEGEEGEGTPEADALARRADMRPRDKTNDKEIKKL